MLVVVVLLLRRGVELEVVMGVGEGVGRGADGGGGGGEGGGGGRVNGGEIGGGSDGEGGDVEGEGGGAGVLVGGGGAVLVVEGVVVRGEEMGLPLLGTLRVLSRVHDERGRVHPGVVDGAINIDDRGNFLTRKTHTVATATLHYSSGGSG